MSPRPAAGHHRDPWVSLGLSVAACSAAISSFSGLFSLAVTAGWAVWMAPLLPATVDALAVTATRIWIAPTTSSTRARRFARATALGAILLSVVGNATYHLIAAGLLAINWLIVLCVGTVPAVALGLISHLAVLRTPPNGRDGEPLNAVPKKELGTVPGPGLTRTGTAQRDDRPATRGPSPGRRRQRLRYGTEDELLAAARTADHRHRQAHGGTGLTRDQLRRSLRISNGRATTVLRALRQNQTSIPTLSSVDHST